MFSDHHIAPADCSIWRCPDLRVERRCRRTTSKVQPSRSRRLCQRFVLEPGAANVLCWLVFFERPRAKCALRARQIGAAIPGPTGVQQGSLLLLTE